MPATPTAPPRDPSSFDLAGLFAPTSEVERYMQTFLDSRPLPKNLREATRYSLMGPGKRLRPILVVRSCEAVGGKLDDCLAPAAAIEMIHCFSLVHDDLPAMDDDDLRRGRPTLHKHTNEAMAILAGDLMQGLAFEIIAAKVTARDPKLAAKLVWELSSATNDMIAGQVYDTLPDFEASMFPLQKLQTIHKHKTGALIRCACRMGALAGGASEADLGAITRYAEAIGLMFQVVDDLLDVTQTTEQLGKGAGKDAEKGKLTYPGVMGLDGTRKEITRLQSEAQQALATLSGGAATSAGTRWLRDLCDYMAVRTK